MSEVTKYAPQIAIMNLGEAFKNFFNNKAKYPKFKKKGRKDSFTIGNDQFKLDGKTVYIPKLGWVRTFEELRFQGKIMSATVSKKADKWFVSIIVEMTVEEYSTFLASKFTKQAENQGTVGVDLGVSMFVSLSTGEVMQAPKPLKTLIKRLIRLSRSLSKKKQGFKNYEKTKKKLARLHARIANIRLDAIHKATSYLIRNFEVICIEDLNVQGMLKNRKLSRAISDMAFFEFRRQLTYKAENTGTLIIVADRYFPSSKTCSSCGFKLEELSLSTRSWVCPKCGTEHERDVNAAKNLRKYALESMM